MLRLLFSAFILATTASACSTWCICKSGCKVDAGHKIWKQKDCTLVCNDRQDGPGRCDPLSGIITDYCLIYNAVRRCANRNGGLCGPYTCYCASRRPPQDHRNTTIPQVGTHDGT
ncbi:hypothetical protein HRS9122_05395 [Pyrenophora teres f. teres]|nr:hypothetical protein HRS9122_05395 [Pyrenophora teres f. teres]